MNAAGGYSANVTNSQSNAESGWGRFIASHVEWPGWSFALTMRDGVLVGFEAYGDGPYAERLRETRNLGNVLLKPPPDGPHLTARMLRKVPLRDLEAAVRRYLARRTGVHMSEMANKHHATLERTLESRERRRAAWGERELAELSAEYVHLVDESDPAPVRTLAERRFQNEKTIRNVLARARSDGLLTRPPDGRAGGELTEKARRLLSGQH